MKTSYKYLAIALATLLCSCNKELAPDTIESQVQISAQIIPTVVTRVTDDGTAFTNGDAIKVQNMNRENKNLATYIYTAATGKWSTTDELYWDGESANTFNAWYPATAAYASFSIPSDQSAGTAAADWMTATTSAKKAAGNVQLAFNHNLAKVTVVIDSWSNEYAANEKIVNSLELNSLSSVMSYNGTLSGDNTAKWVKTYTSQANTSFVAIVAPAAYNADTDIMQVYVNGASAPLKVKTTSSVKIESGKAYTFKLTVGKNLATISSSVTIGEWDDVVLDNQQAGVVTSQNKYIDEYGVNHGEGVEIDGVVWAPVNCGYHATDYPYGKLYQWGRKYGQGLGGDYDSYVLSTLQGTVSLEDGQSISNADKFITTTGGNDWLKQSDGTLWNSGTEEDPVKTSYDPCPAGWRVPTKTEQATLIKKSSSWVTVNDLVSGKYFSGSKTYSESVPNIFLMALYSRDFSNNGAQYAQGTGQYWSSSTEDSYTALRISMPENSYTQQSSGSRAFGHSVRCVQDFKYTPEPPVEEPSEKAYIDEYGINQGQGVNIDGVVWAPVNCGYHATDYKYGKLYQWGRKYGQGYDSSDASVPTIVAGPVSLSEGQSASNSNVYYNQSDTPYDWVTPVNDKLWNSGTEDNPIKTGYDPCPNGWRVPTNDELNNLKSNRSDWTTLNGQYGYWFSGSNSYSEAVPRVFFPAAGYRNDDRGRALDRGNVGKYWCSSGPTMSYNLNFDTTIANVLGSDRQSGNSVRCVKE